MTQRRMREIKADAAKRRAKLLKEYRKHKEACDMSMAEFADMQTPPLTRERMRVLLGKAEKDEM